MLEGVIGRQFVAISELEAANQELTDQEVARGLERADLAAMVRAGLAHVDAATASADAARRTIQELSAVLERWIAPKRALAETAPAQASEKRFKPAKVKGKPGKAGKPSPPGAQRWVQPSPKAAAWLVANKRCQSCGAAGHWRRDCPLKAEKGKADLELKRVLKEAEAQGFPANK